MPALITWIDNQQNHAGLSITPINTTGATLLTCVVGVITSYQGFTRPIADFGTISIQDNFGNTWIPLPSATADYVTLWYCYNPIVGVNHQIVASASGGTPAPFVVWSEIAAWSGTITSSAVYQAGSLAQQSIIIPAHTPNKVQAGSVSPSAGDLVLLGNVGWSSVSIDNGTIVDGTVGVGSIADAYIISDGTTVNPTWTGQTASVDERVSAIAAVFKASVPLTVTDGNSGRSASGGQTLTCRPIVNRVWADGEDLGIHAVPLAITTAGPWTVTSNNNFVLLNGRSTASGTGNGSVTVDIATQNMPQTYLGRQFATPGTYTTTLTVTDGSETVTVVVTMMVGYGDGSGF